MDSSRYTRQGMASKATSHIDEYTDTGIVLADGEFLPWDMLREIVTELKSDRDIFRGSVVAKIDAVLEAAR